MSSEEVVRIVHILHAWSRDLVFTMHILHLFTVYLNFIFFYIYFLYLCAPVPGTCIIDFEFFVKM